MSSLNSEILKDKFFTESSPANIKSTNLQNDKEFKKTFTRYLTDRFSNDLRVSRYSMNHVSMDLMKASEEIVVSDNLKKLTKMKTTAQEIRNSVFKHEIPDPDDNEKKIIVIQEEENSVYFDPYQIPPNIELSMIHQKSNRFGFEISERNLKSSVISMERPSEQSPKRVNIELNDLKTINEEISEDEIKGDSENQSRKFSPSFGEEGTIEYSSEAKSNFKSTFKSSFKSSFKDYDNFEECPCCFEPLNKLKPTLGFDPEELHHLGAAYPLFFRLIKTILYFIILPYFCGVLIPHIYFSYHECHLLASISLCEYEGSEEEKSNKFFEVVSDRLINDLLFSLYFSIVVTWFRVSSIRYIKNHQRMNHISQFTLFIKNIPENETEEDIRNFFEQLEINKERNILQRFIRCLCFKKNTNKNVIPIRIEEVNMIYNLTDFIYLEKAIMKLINQRRKVLSFSSIQKKLKLNRNETTNSLITIDKNIALLIQERNKYIKEINEQTDQSLKFTGNIFICFDSHQSAKRIYSMFNTFLRKRINRYKGNKLVVEWAAEPEELIWENIGVFTSKTLFRILCFFALFFLIFFIGFVVNTIYHSLESDILLQELGVALLILVLNKCLNLLIRKIISLNKHKTKPKEEFFAIKMVFPFILANIFGYELLEYAEAIFHGVLDKTESFIEVEKIIHKILFVSIFISLLEPFIKLIFDFKNLYKVYEQYKLRNDPSYNDYCQKEANSIFEPPKFELTEFYFDAILIFVIGTFGSAFYPPCFIITFVALFLLYWYFKYLVLYRCQVEPVKDENFFYYFMRILTLSPLFFNFGIYFNAKKLFDSQNEDERNLKPYFYCLLTISLLLIIVNLFQFRKIIYIKMKRNESTFDQVKEKYQNKNYSQIQAIFKTK